MVSPNQERGRSFGLLHQKRLFRNGQNLCMCLLPQSLKFLCLGMGIILPPEAQLEELLFVLLLSGIQLGIFHQLQMELPNWQLMYNNSASNIVHMHHSSILTSCFSILTRFYYLFLFLVREWAHIMVSKEYQRWHVGFKWPYIKGNEWTQFDKMQRHTKKARCWLAWSTRWKGNFVGWLLII